MPNLTVKVSPGMKKYFGEDSSLLGEMHSYLQTYKTESAGGIEENVLTPARLKTYLVPCERCIVGTEGQTNEVINIEFGLGNKPGRTDKLSAEMVGGLMNIVADHLKQQGLEANKDYQVVGYGHLVNRELYHDAPPGPARQR